MNRIYTSVGAFTRVLLLLAVFVMAFPAQYAYAGTQSFQGNFTDGAEYIYFTILKSSEVKFEFNSECSTPLTFYLIVAERIDDWDRAYSIAYKVDRSSPVSRIPLHAGSYYVNLRCSSVGGSPPEPEWNLAITTSTLAVRYQYDNETLTQQPVNLAGSRSFEGWLGLWGVPEEIHPTANTSQGHDLKDKRFLNLEKGTKLKVRISWDSFVKHTNTDVDFGFSIYWYRNGNGYYVYSKKFENSGDTSDEITIPEDGTYLLNIGDGYNTDINNDTIRYGSYKLTAIINGEEIPDTTIYGIKSISTQYWSDTLHKIVNAKDLVRGEKSIIDLLISNPTPNTIPATLVWGLSVQNGPIKIAGSTRLSIAPSGNASAVYKTSLLTPSDTPLTLKGDLVAVLYSSNNETLDTYTKSVDFYHPDLPGYSIIGALNLLLGRNILDN